MPFAAASIGQVHKAILSSSVSPSGREEPVAVKIQFPNIASSIDSDLGYITLLLTAGRFLPKGLFLDKTIQVRFILKIDRSRDSQLVWLTDYESGACG